LFISSSGYAASKLFADLLFLFMSIEAGGNALQEIVSLQMYAIPYWHERRGEPYTEPYASR